jgi:hypothetical protein
MPSTPDRQDNLAHRGVPDALLGTRSRHPPKTYLLEDPMFRAIADVLRSVGGAIATVVTLPFRALARLFGGASRSAH